MLKILISAVMSLLLSACSGVSPKPTDTAQLDIKKIKKVCGEFDYTVNFKGGASVTLDEDVEKALGIIGKWSNLVPSSMGVDLTRGAAAAFERQAIDNTWHRFNCYYQQIDPSATLVEQEFRNELNAYLTNLDELTVSTAIPSDKKMGELQNRAKSHQQGILKSVELVDRRGIPKIDVDVLDDIIPNPDFTNEWVIKGVAKSKKLGEVCATAGQVVAKKLSGTAAYAMSAMRQNLIQFATTSMEPRTLYANLIRQVYFSGEQSFDPKDSSSIAEDDLRCLKEASTQQTKDNAKSTPVQAAQPTQAQSASLPAKTEVPTTSAPLSASPSAPTASAQAKASVLPAASRTLPPDTAASASVQAAQGATPPEIAEGKR